MWKYLGYFEGIQSWVSIPNNYYQIEDRYEQMNIWNQSLLETINSNNAIIQSLTLDDFIPQMYESTSESESPYVKTSLISDDCSEFSASPETTVRGLTTIMTMKIIKITVRVIIVVAVIIIVMITFVLSITTTVIMIIQLISCQ